MVFPTVISQDFLHSGVAKRPLMKYADCGTETCREITVGKAVPLNCPELNMVDIIDLHGLHFAHP